MFELIAMRLQDEFPTLQDDAVHDLALDIARMGRALTDGFRVAAAAGDDTDFERAAEWPRTRWNSSSTPGSRSSPVPETTAPAAAFSNGSGAQDTLRGSRSRVWSRRPSDP